METVIGKLVAIIGQDPLCLSCGHKRFDVNVVKLTPQPPNVPLSVSLVGGPYMPYLALTCKRCGYAQLYNLVNLGFIPNIEGRLVQPETPSWEDNAARRLIDEAFSHEDRPWAQH